MGIGHVRYPTAGCASSAEAQPFYVNSPYGICLAHNGNLTNAEELKRDLFREDRRHINTDSDSEILLNVFAHELGAETSHLSFDENDVFGAVAGVHRRCRGGYAAVAMIPGYGVVAFRDPNGIRPLVFGERDSDRRPGNDGRLGERGAGHPGVRARARRRARRGGDPDTGWQAAYPPVCGESAALPLHLRVRLFRPAGFHHRRYLRPQGPPAHGQEAGEEDRARAGPDTISTW